MGARRKDHFPLFNCSVESCLPNSPRGQGSNAALGTAVKGYSEKKVGMNRGHFVPWSSD